MAPLNARIQLFDAVTGEHVGYFWALQPGTWCKADKPNQAMVVEIPDGSENLSLKILVRVSLIDCTKDLLFACLI